MKIKSQDSNIYEAHNVEMCNCKIYCTGENMHEKHFLGQYPTKARTCCIVAEIATDTTGYYEMPKE